MIQLKNKKILVTGATGFIGSHLVEALLPQTAHLRVFVKYNSQGRTGWLSDLPQQSQSELDYHFGDLRDSDSVLKAMNNIDIVFHLGAIISIPYSYHSPGETFSVNVEGTRNILEAGRKLNIEQIMHTSTSEVFGTALYVPIDEKHPYQGQSPYSASKIAADKLVESYYRSFNLRLVTIRPFNTFGPRQSPRAVIPTIILQLLKSNQLHLGSLTPTRDFTFVSDTVQGMINSINCESAIGKEINLGTGQEISIENLVKTISNIMGVSPEIKTIEKKLRPSKSEVNQLLSDNTMAKDILSWHPECSLENGLKKTIDWFKENKNHYNNLALEFHF